MRTASVVPEANPYPASQAFYWHTAGRALGHIKGRAADAVLAYRRAEDLYPVQLYRDAGTREVVSALLTRVLHDAVGAESLWVPNRCGCRVAAGEPMLSPTVTRQLITHLTGDTADLRRRRARELFTELSDREREVAIALGHGKSNAEIATELFVSVATVKAYVSLLLTKLELNNRVQVALLAHDAGLA